MTEQVNTEKVIVGVDIPLPESPPPDQKDEQKEIHINTHKNAQKEMHVDMHGEVYDTDEMVPFGVTSFDEYEAAVESQKAATETKKMSAVLKDIIYNILRVDDPDFDAVQAIKEAASQFADRVGNALSSKETVIKTEGSVKYRASDFAYTPDPQKPSTWKLRLAENKSGNITKSQLGRAAAAFSAGGFRGNKVQIPSNKVSAVKSKIRSAYRKLGVKMEDMPDSIKENGTFMVYKDGELYKFITTYSNNIRDQDNPPEIISSKSHERFEELVNKGEVPLPELWLWHTPEWNIGQTTAIVYDKDNGIAIAAGYFFKHASPIAEAIMENPDAWGVSHGMPSESIVRSKDDRTIIEQHITKEISPLPAYAAANKWADFTVLKEATMSLTEEKRKKLQDDGGVTPEILAVVEERSAAVSQKANELDLDRKEQTQETDVEQEPAPELAPETEKKEETQETVPNASSAFSDEQLKELTNAFTAYGKTLTEGILTAVKEELTPILKQQEAEVKSEEDRIKERIELTPPMSLADLILGGSVLKQMSATQDESTKVDGRSSLAKDGPEITEPDGNMLVATGVPFLDMVATDIAKGNVFQDLKTKAKTA
jgi:hypothetical protein